jgi:hypothetical protein
MNSKQKGDVAIANAIRYYVTNHYEVCLPLGDKKPYDFIVDKDGILKKVQVKYAGFYQSAQQHTFAQRVMGGNRSWSTVKKYQDGDFDELLRIQPAEDAL